MCHQALESFEICLIMLVSSLFSPLEGSYLGTSSLSLPERGLCSLQGPCCYSKTFCVPNFLPSCDLQASQFAFEKIESFYCSLDLIAWAYQSRSRWTACWNEPDIHWTYWHSGIQSFHRRPWFRRYYCVPMIAGLSLDLSVLDSTSDCHRSLFAL